MKPEYLYTKQTKINYEVYLSNFKGKKIKQIKKIKKKKLELIKVTH